MKSQKEICGLDIYLNLNLICNILKKTKIPDFFVAVMQRLDVRKTKQASKNIKKKKKVYTKEPLFHRRKCEVFQL